MKSIRNNIYFYLAGALVITLSGCSGGGEDSTTTTSSSPYPDPEDPSAFPTQADTLEGSGGDNTLGTARTLSIGSSSYHTIYPIDDEDWGAVSLTGGTQYEFSADNVSDNGYPRLQIYNSTATEINPLDFDDDSSWGYFAANPRILYTPLVSGTYYIKISDYAGGIASYTLSSRVFSDGDGDTYSAHYDCSDTVVSVFPLAPEIPSDTIDQSCSGHDWPSSDIPDAVDSTTPDNDFSTAGSLPMLKGDRWDIIYRREVYAETHTIHVSDIDTFKITVPAYGAYEIIEVESSGAPLDSDVYESDQTTIYDFTDSGGSITHWLDNSASAAPADFYLKVYATVDATLATYVLGLSNGGTDVDGDLYFSRSQGSGWDCNDSNAAIFAGAPETASDGTDSNCNGKDDD